MFNKISHRRILKEIKNISHEIANLCYQTIIEDRFNKRFSLNEIKNQELFQQIRSKRSKIIREYMENIDKLTKKRPRSTEILKNRAEEILRETFRVRNIQLSGGDQLFIFLQTVFYEENFSKLIENIQLIDHQKQPSSAPISPQSERELANIKNNSQDLTR